MDAGNALHGFAVTQGQAFAVDVLEFADMRAAITGDRNCFLVRQGAGHRRAPQVFAVQLAVGEAVDLLQIGQGRRRIRLGRCDEFQQRLGVVSGDLRMGQRRAEGGRVRREGQLAIAVDAQAFALDTVQALGKQGEVGALAKLGQAAG